MVKKLRLLEADFKITKKQVRINNSSCWICGFVFEDDEKMRTTHHCLPKYRHPEYNVLIDICKICHAKINSKDFAGMTASVETMNKKIDKLKDEVGRLSKCLSYVNSGDLR